jgi:hypothetical protein
MTPPTRNPLNPAASPGSVSRMLGINRLRAWADDVFAPKSPTREAAESTAAINEAPGMADKAPCDPRIPEGLTEEEIAVYTTLFEVCAQRANDKINPRGVLVVTDIAKDYDDLAAMILLKELHRLGLIRLEGFIANLMPAIDRAKYGRGALDLLGLKDVPIAWGEKASETDHCVHDYEFDCDFIPGDITIFPQDHMNITNPARHEIEPGYSLFERLVKFTPRSENCRSTAENANPRNKLTLVLLSSLADAAIYAENNPAKLAGAIANIVLQGGYELIPDSSTNRPTLFPDLTAANNRFDIKSADAFHEYMANFEIPSTVFTKHAAVACPLPMSVFGSIASHPLGAHLVKAKEAQDFTFYERACNPDPTKRFAPAFDQDWVLRTRTNWYDNHDASEALPVGKAVLPYMTKIIVYDALAALGAGGDDVMAALDVLEPKENGTRHNIIGVDKNRPDIHADRMAVVVGALIRGSIFAMQQGIKSNPIKTPSVSSLNFSSEGFQ